MNANISCLIQACDQLKLSYESMHPSRNLVRIESDAPMLFANWTTPLNPHSTVRICRDKDYCYTLLKDVIPMPKTKAFLNPDIQEQYERYKDHHTVEEIQNTILQEFDLPVIIKRNAGSHGSNVFIAETSESITEFLYMIYDAGHKDYDFVALAQEKIEMKHEYRVVVLDGEIQFFYEKDTSEATFTGNLSPLHWDDAKAVLIDDLDMQSRLQEMIAPLFMHLPLVFGGLDIVVDPNDQLFVLEINTAPSFGKFLRDNGEDKVVELYKKMLVSNHE